MIEDWYRFLIKGGLLLPIILFLLTLIGATDSVSASLVERRRLGESYSVEPPRVCATAFERVRLDGWLENLFSLALDWIGPRGGNYLLSICCSWSKVTLLSLISLGCSVMTIRFMFTRCLRSFTIMAFSL